MKRFSSWVNHIRESEERKKSDLQLSYEEYFLKRLSKYGVKSPVDLSDEDKKKFFDEISSEWEEGRGLKNNIAENLSFDINEDKINNAEEFKRYAEALLKKAHGDKYDQKKADKLIKALSAEAEKLGDWGVAIGKLKHSGSS